MKTLNNLIQQHFQQNMVDRQLFRVTMTGRAVWDLYLKSFLKKNDPVFRDPQSTVHNCNHCKNFIRRYGNIVAIDDDGNLISLFDVDASDEYSKSMKAISKKIKASKIENVFLETFDELKSLPYEACKRTQKVFRLGVKDNHKRYTKDEAELYGVVKEGEIRTFDHFFLDIPKQFVDMSGSSVESLMAHHRTNMEVFQRAMEEISLDTFILVKDLINQGSLLNAESQLSKIETMVEFKTEYDELAKKYQPNWCWVKSRDLNIAKFRNELIGVLCVELSQGEDINKACLNWNKRVDPVNYMKASAPITKKQVEAAKKYVDENGYESSFNRRYATLSDIDISEILHVNSGDGVIKTASIFDGVTTTKKSRHSRNEFENVEEISINKFMETVLPSATSLEVFLENQHAANMMTLTTSVDQGSKPIFNYSNNYSQTFNGNLAGKSEIKTAVKAAGGKVDGVLRCSISWNEDGRSRCDFDVHAQEPNGSHISFSRYRGRDKTSMTGNLDVDMIRPTKLGVENITWSDRSKMKDGEYKFWVKNYDKGRNTGFNAEIEMDNDTFNYRVEGSVMKDTEIARVNIKDGRMVDITHKLPHTSTSKNIYGLDSNNFHKVNLMCLSPNHWGENEVGNKNYLFMLEGCKTPASIRSFHNVDLIPELRKHRKVLEVLGNTCMIEPTNGDQLSGLGFNATVRDEVLVKVQGSHKRMLKIKF